MPKDHRLFSTVRALYDALYNKKPKKKNAILLCGFIVSECRTLKEEYGSLPSLQRNLDNIIGLANSIIETLSQKTSGNSAALRTQISSAKQYFGEMLGRVQAAEKLLKQMQ